MMNGTCGASAVHKDSLEARKRSFDRLHRRRAVCHNEPACMHACIRHCPRPLSPAIPIIESLRSELAKAHPFGPPVSRRTERPARLLSARPRPLRRLSSTLFPLRLSFLHSSSSTQQTTSGRHTHPSRTRKASFLVERHPPPAFSQHLKRARARTGPSDQLRP